MLTSASSDKVQNGAGQSAYQSVENHGKENVVRDQDVERDESEIKWALGRGVGTLLALDA